MIRKDSYMEHVTSLGFDNLPKPLQQAHLVIMAKSNQGRDWNFKSDKDLQELLEVTFTKLERMAAKNTPELAGEVSELSGKPRKKDDPIIQRAKDDAAGYPDLDTRTLKMILMLERSAEIEDGPSEEITIRKKALERILKQRGESIEGVAGLEGKAASEWKYLPEYRIFWRFIALDQKRKHKDEILQLLESLQNSILQKNIRKTSPFAKEVRFIQDHLVQTYNAIKGDHVVIQLKEETGKKIIRAIRKIEKENETLSYPKSKAKPVALSGTPEKTIMASTEFTELSFPSIGLKGKWLTLIGDPSPGFSAMISGKPKMGKSYLAVDFAGYLARNHGPVLYVAREEKLDATLQKKLKEKDVAHPELYVSDHLPEDLTAYQFIFLDSVNKLGLNPEDLDRLRTSNPGKSFIFIFQTTKDGKFRGSNEFQHDVDVVIEIPERGKAIQFGRFNQGGEMVIFPEASTDLTFEDNVPLLAGLNSQPMNGKPDKKEQELSVHVQDYYWGKLATIRKGNDWQAVLHPEHIEAVNNLKKGESLMFTDEQKEKWKVTNNVDLFNLQNLKKNYQGTFRLNSDHYPEWVKAPYYSEKDREDLKRIYLLLTEKKYKEAMALAMDRDTVIREQIPNEYWIEMGGELTPKGKAELKKNKAKSQEEILKAFQDREDNLNPVYLFSLAHSQLLSEALKGQFDVHYLIRREMANRGLDEDGNWVGFPKAKEIHKIGN